MVGHIFVSYSRADIQSIDRLAKALKEAEIEIWVDREGIAGGEKWRSQIVNAIKSASGFVIALSPDSVKSDNVRRELAVAEKAKKPIVPVVLRPTIIPTDLEYTLEELQRIDLVADHSAGVERLLKALQRLDGTSAARLQATGDQSSRVPDQKAQRDLDYRKSDMPEIQPLGPNPPQLFRGRQVPYASKAFENEVRQIDLLRSSGASPELMESKRRAILADPTLSDQEKIKAFCLAFPVNATPNEKARAILGDAKLRTGQQIAALVALMAEQARTTDK